jgi:hypothetical protein
LGVGFLLLSGSFGFLFLADSFGLESLGLPYFAHRITFHKYLILAFRFKRICNSLGSLLKLAEEEMVHFIDIEHDVPYGIHVEFGAFECLFVELWVGCHFLWGSGLLLLFAFLSCGLWLV